VACGATLSLHSKLNLKARHSGERRLFVEQAVGDDLHRKSGRSMKFYRLIDRAKKWYHIESLTP
jgi:hypothetical protein